MNRGSMAMTPEQSLSFGVEDPQPLWDWRKHRWGGCSSWLCSTWSNSKQGGLPWYFAAFVGCYLLENATIAGIQWVVNGTMTTHLPIQCSSFWLSAAFPLVWHPPHSPDLTLCDLFLFPKLKHHLKGRKFQDVEELKVNVMRQLWIISELKFQKCFHKGDIAGFECVASERDS